MYYNISVQDCPSNIVVLNCLNSYESFHWKVYELLHKSNEDELRHEKLIFLLFKTVATYETQMNLSKNKLSSSQSYLV